jgi:hypothetical protein
VTQTLASRVSEGSRFDVSFYRWQKEFFENGAAAFEPKRPKNHSGSGLHSFNDSKVAFRAGAERVKCLLVSDAFVSSECDVIALQLDNDSPLLQSGFKSLELAYLLIDNFELAKLPYRNFRMGLSSRYNMFSWERRSQSRNRSSRDSKIPNSS